MRPADTLHTPLSRSISDHFAPITSPLPRGRQYRELESARRDAVTLAQLLHEGRNLDEGQSVMMLYTLGRSLLRKGRAVLDPLQDALDSLLGARRRLLFVVQIGARASVMEAAADGRYRTRPERAICVLLSVLLH